MELIGYIMIDVSCLRVHNSCRQGNAIYPEQAHSTLHFDFLLHNQLNFNVL